MSDTQLLTIALAALPNMLAVLVGILINNARLNDTNTRIADTNTRIAELRVHMDSRFDDMRDTWRSELRRVEADVETLSAFLRARHDLDREAGHRNGCVRAGVGFGRCDLEHGRQRQRDRLRKIERQDRGIAAGLRAGWGGAGDRLGMDLARGLAPGRTGVFCGLRLRLVRRRDPGFCDLLVKAGSLGRARRGWLCWSRAGGFAVLG